MQRSLRREARKFGVKLVLCGIKEAEGRQCFKKLLSDKLKEAETRAEFAKNGCKTGKLN